MFRDPALRLVTRRIRISASSGIYKWHFDGVDPSLEMLELARRTLGPLASRIALHEDYIESAPIVLLMEQHAF